MQGTEIMMILVGIISSEGQQLKSTWCIQSFAWDKSELMNTRALKLHYQLQDEA